MKRLTVIICIAIACGSGCGTDGGAAVTRDGGVADGGAVSDAGSTMDAGEPGDAGWREPFPPAVCGAPSYRWLDPATMGKVVKYEPVPEYSLDKKSINDLLAQQGFGTVEAKYGIKLYRYRYETQDRGKKIEATAMLSIPDLLGAEQTSPYALWLHGTSGWSDKCAASRLIEWILAAGLVASQGYIGVAPDYIGMSGMGDPSTEKNPYMIGEPTAIASWDAVRAAESMLKRVKSGITPDNRVVVWGASQGGHATLFTERYAPHYAPEYQVVGALALIPPSNLVEDLISVFNDYNDGLYFRAAFTTALVRWYGYEGRLAEVFNAGPPHDFTKLIPEAMETTCTITLGDWGVTRASDVYTQAFVDAFIARDWAALDPWHCLFAENSIDLSSVPRTSSTPFYWVIGENDDLVRAPVARQMFDTLCGAGYSMEFLECAGAGHTEAGTSSMKEQLDWAAARLAGTPLSRPCEKSAPICCSGATNAGCKGQ